MEAAAVTLGAAALADFRVADRLRTLLTRLTDSATGDGTAVTETLEAASADEVFAFIDAELHL
jgi:hypothetical protein